MGALSRCWFVTLLLVQALEFVFVWLMNQNVLQISVSTTGKDLNTEQEAFKSLQSAAENIWETWIKPGFDRKMYKLMEKLFFH